MKILITGASSGIGAELSRLYATPENELILLARRKERLQELKLELVSAKNIELIEADISNFESLQKKIRNIGAVDMVILNAGISIGHSLEITPFEDFKKLYDTNLYSVHAILEVLLPYFIINGGKIVFISSLASLFTMPTSIAYSSSKCALNAYAEGLVYKYKKHGIKVINILPGFIKSEMTDKNSFYMPFLLSTEDGAKIIKKAIDKNGRFYPFPFRFYILITILKFLPLFLREKIVDFIISK